MEVEICSGCNGSGRGDVYIEDVYWDCELCDGSGVIGEPSPAAIKTWNAFLEEWAPGFPTKAAFVDRFTKMFGTPPTESFVKAHVDTVQKMALRAGEVFRAL